MSREAGWAPEDAAEASSTSNRLPASPDDRTVISKRPPLAAASPLLASTAQHLGQTLVGKRLEHYELDEFVGGGGMGAVFRATDTRLGRTVAVKVLSRDHTDDETIRRFQNEAQSAARLDHPNIARVHYVGEDSGWNFIVFEFIEGTNLRDLVEERGPLPLEEALQYTLQVAEALAHSSSRDVVHRDIKPSNVLVMSGGQVKLVDMGLARLHQVESSADDLTASGVTLGTFDYISPEQARDPRSADVRSDIYSLGCTLYYMLTGRPPFPDGTALQKLLKHNADEPPDVLIFRPELSPRIGALLSHMLAKRPSQRHQTAAELVAEILAIGQQLGLTSITQHGQVVVAAETNRAEVWYRTWQVLAAAAVLIAGIVLLDAYLPSRGASSDVALRPSKLLPPDEPTAADVVVPAVVRPENQDNGSGAVEPVAPPIVDTPPPATTGSDAATAAATAGPSAASPESTNGGGSADVLPTAIATPLAAGIALPPIEGALGPEPMEASVTASITTVVDPPRAAPVDPPIKPRRVVVVGSRPTPPEPETVHAETLAQAYRRAADLGLNEIELRFSGRLVERPLEIAVPRMTLRAADGFRPVVVFQPTTGIGGKEMIRLAGGESARLAIEGIELRMELPTERPATGWTLLAMSPGQRLDISQSVLTVQDGDATRGAIHDQVATIAVHARMAAESTMTMDMQPASMPSSASINIKSTIARGAATFLAMPVETVLSLSWSHGLLVTPGRLIETGGSPTDPRGYGISVRLENVTAVAGQGLYQMKLQPGAAYTMVTTVTTRHCILTSDPGAPLFDYVGVSSVGPEDLRLEGSDNCYPNDVYFLRVHSGAAGETPTLHYLNRHPSSNEMSSKPGDPWLHPPPDRPPHELTKHDFVPDELADGAGFDPDRLPEASAPPYESPLDPFTPPPAEEVEEEGETS